jgi:hypothetical protein
MAQKPAHKPGLKQRFQAAVRKGRRRALLVPFAAGALMLSPAALARVPTSTYQTAADQSAALPYTQQLFLQNKDSVTTPAPAGLTPGEQADFYRKALCFSAADLVPPPVPPAANTNAGAPDAGKKVLADAVAVLEKLPLTGKPLVDLAVQDKTSFCALAHMPGGVAAQYLPQLQSVASGPITHGESRALQIAHELTHAAQDQNGLLNYQINWDIESRVLRNTAVEAAAMTMEFLAAYDAKLGGDDSLWKGLQKNRSFAYGDPKMYRLIDETYKAGIAAGKTPQESLRAAGLAGWQEIYQSADWRRFYLNTELMNYMADIDKNLFAHAAQVYGGKFTQEMLDKAGKVGTLPSFTQGAAVPGINDLLAGDAKMLWAYQAADIARYAQMKGAQSAEVQVRRAQAVKDGNPYLDLDMREMYRRARAAQWRSAQNLYDVMDAALKEKANEAAAPKKTAAAAPAAPAPGKAG